jgi:hypothetical protein
VNTPSVHTQVNLLPHGQINGIHGMYSSSGSWQRPRFVIGSVLMRSAAGSPPPMLLVIHVATN